jgi:hypothetical protein
MGSPWSQNPAHTTPRENKKTKLGYKPLGKRKQNDRKKRTGIAPTVREKSPRTPIKIKQNKNNKKNKGGRFPHPPKEKMKG